jgi:hypothetical protein
LFDFAVNGLEAETVAGEHLLLVRKSLEPDTTEEGRCSLGSEENRNIAAQDIPWLSTSSFSTNSAKEVGGLLDLSQVSLEWVLIAGYIQFHNKLDIPYQNPLERDLGQV